MPEAFKDLLLAGQTWSFLGEVALRSALSFILVLVALKCTGKRGVRQLTLFELVIILTLGSAAGDVAFYKDVGLLPVVFTLATIILVYRLTTYLILKWPRLERLVEGEAVNIIEDGRFTDFFVGESISSDEFFMELRIRGIEHLGQVRRAILEVNGDVSVFRQPEKDIRPGLDICPEKFKKKYNTVPFPGLFSCIGCGYTSSYRGNDVFGCTECGCRTCAEASDRFCRENENDG